MRPRAVIAAFAIGSFMVPGAFTEVASAKTRRCGAKDLSLTLRTDRKRYDRDDPVHIVFRVENTSQKACRAVWSSGRRASVAARRNRKEIWLNDRCYGYTQAIVEERWPPGHEDAYRWRWRQRDNRERSKACGNGPAPRAPAGRYTLVASFYGAYRKSGVLTARVAIKVGKARR